MRIKYDIKAAMRNHINVKVTTTYIENQSLPAQNRYVFAYTITISNEGETAARLISRHWVITAGDGSEQEVRGEGVVGEQPYIKPGASYEYTSGTVMESPVGSMRGTYQMISGENEKFDAIIHPFTLSIPHALH